MSIKLRAGTPLPYTLRSVRGDDGRFVQHAVVGCCDCTETEAFAWVEPENPTLICVRFERKGWVIYQNKARCPACGIKRKKQQAIFASRRDQMQTPVRPTLHPVPPPTEQPAERRVFVLVIDEHGNATITPAHDIQEMLFGNVTYLVIPQNG